MHSASLDGAEGLPSLKEARRFGADSFCIEENQHVRIGKDSYMLSADGLLMPPEGPAAAGLALFQSAEKVGRLFAVPKFDARHSTASHSLGNLRLVHHGCDLVTACTNASA